LRTRPRRDLVVVGKQDPIAVQLSTQAIKLIELLKDVVASTPNPSRLQQLLKSSRLFGDVLYRGIEALGWVVEERGLGGGQEQDGLAWQLPLERLWENYVESVIRKEVSLTGGEVRTGRLRQTVFPMHWSSPSHRSLGHLVPDIVVKRGNEVRVVDAKYKAHLAELDEAGWRAFTDDAREAHRADIHQVLAYASLFDADAVTASLIYPIRQSAWESLAARGQDVARARLLSGGRNLTIELRGLPFGSSTHRAKLSLEQL
jgi:5-methylcytosine-specific restriction endonuclease McrBC regulatory subunit McrC